MTPEELAECRRTFGEVTDAHVAAGNHRMHFTGFWRTTLRGQYFWHCLDCKWYFIEWEDRKMRAHYPVIEAERLKACGSCESGVDLKPNYPT